METQVAPVARSALVCEVCQQEARELHNGLEYHFQLGRKWTHTDGRWCFQSGEYSVRYSRGLSLERYPLEWLL